MNYKRIAELHWIAYSMTARIYSHVPMWDDLIEQQQNSLADAMQMLIELDHLKVVDEPVS